MGTEAALVIPQRPRTEIATGFNLDVKRQVATVTDIVEVDEARRRLAAWQAYVTKREQRDEIAAASRWCEIRIGELLGPAERGGDRSKSPTGDMNRATRTDHYKFRLLAQYKPMVSKLIADGQVSRGHLLQAIKEYTTHEQPPEPKGHHIIADLSELSGKQFGTVYADPPWQYGNQSTRAATGKHYQTMPLDALCEMPIADLVADDAHLHLWTTNAFLPESFRLIEAWGFEYRSIFVWVKPQMGIGNYWRVSHELLLLGIRGDAKRFSNRSLKSWGEFKRGRHSSKPEEIRGFIETASPGPYLELFGRKPVDGWTILGDQGLDEKRLFA